MSTFFKKSIAILLGIVFFAGGISIAGAATVDVSSGGSNITLDPNAAPSFSFPTAGETSAPLNLGTSVATPITPTVGEQLVTPTSVTTAIMANAVTVNSLPYTQAQVDAAKKELAAAQAAYTAGTGSQNEVAAATSKLSAAQAALANAGGTVVAPGDTSDNNPDLKGIDCNITNGAIGTGKLSHCVPYVVYYLVYKPAMYLLMGAGLIFDKSLQLSIDSHYVGDPAFINSSWKVIRDFSNMAFIFVLLYTGIMTMLGGGNWKRTVIQVVIVALLINFSLFFTKIVIDAGNILATGIYSSIDTGTSFSASLAGSFRPQGFLKVAGTTADPVNATIVFIVAAIVSAFAAYVFFKAALLFIGRLLAFWLLMIVSPFAFISTTFPEGKGNVFSKWFGHLTGQAFVAPLFLFLLYVIMQVINAGNGLLSTLGSSSWDSGAGWFNALIPSVLLATMLILALKESLDFAEDMAGKFGKLGATLGGAVMGVAALGGATVAQKTVGRAALAASKNEGFKSFATKSKWGRIAYGLNERAVTGTYDVRNTSPGSKLGIGAGTKGNFAKTVSEAKATDEAFGKKVTVDKDGKPIIVGKDAEGRDITAADAYSKQLEGGYVSRIVTGGNIGASEAAGSIKKKEEKRQKLDKKQKEKTESFLAQLSLPVDTKLDSKEVEVAKEKILNNLERTLAKAELDLEAIKKYIPNDPEAHLDAILNKKKAEKDLKKFEGTQAEIEKVQKELAGLADEKSGKKEENKKEEKH